MFIMVIFMHCVCKYVMLDNETCSSIWYRAAIVLASLGTLLPNSTFSLKIPSGACYTYSDTYCTRRFVGGILESKGHHTGLF